MNKDEIKAAVPMRRLLDYYGVNRKGNTIQCLLPENHQNGDANFSAAEKDDRLTCFGCDAFQGADIFAVVGIVENLSSFAEQKKCLEDLFNLNGHPKSQTEGPRKILRRYMWTDSQGHVAWHLRLEGN